MTVPSPTAPPGRAGRPPATSRAEILAAARALIDREGWEKLTIRRLAAELGIGATTVYHHVRDKEDVLVQLLNAHVEQLARPELPDDPRDRIVVAAQAIHDALAAWPLAAEVLATDGFLRRLGRSALWMVEAIVAGAVDCGCSPAQAVDLFRNVWYYTVGEIIVRAHSRRRPAAPLAPGERFFTGDMSGLPRLAAVGDRWQELAARDVYPAGLAAFVDGLLAQAAPSQPRRGPAGRD